MAKAPLTLLAVPDDTEWLAINSISIHECTKKAEAGHPMASYRLAWAYATGGVARDYVKARKWLGLAKEQAQSVQYQYKSFSYNNFIRQFPRHVEDLKPSKICWDEWEDVSECYGLSYYYRRQTKGKYRRVAWVRYFEWLHGFPKTVQVYCITPDAATTKTELATLKDTIASLIHAKRLPDVSVASHLRTAETDPYHEERPVQWVAAKDALEYTDDVIPS